MSRDCRVGQVGVQAAAAELLRAGWEVAVPLVDTGHDLIAYEGDTAHIRIQVKSHTGFRKQKLVRVQRIKNSQRMPYEPEMLEAVAVCNVRTLDVKFVPMKSLNGKSCVSFSSPLLVDAEGLRDSMASLD